MLPHIKMAVTLAQWEHFMAFNRMASLAEYLHPHMKGVLHHSSIHGYSPDMYGLFRRTALSPPYQQVVRNSVRMLMGGGMQSLDDTDVERYTTKFAEFAAQFREQYGVDMQMHGTPAQTDDRRSVIAYTNTPGGRRYTWTQQALDTEDDTDLEELMAHMKRSMRQEIRPKATVTAATETSREDPTLGEQVVLRCFYQSGTEEVDSEDIPATGTLKPAL